MKKPRLLLQFGVTAVALNLLEESSFAFNIEISFQKRMSVPSCSKTRQEQMFSFSKA